MKAIFESGIPMSFKGAMVLKACLIEAGYPEEIRHTIDIDANWNFEKQLTSEQIAASLENALKSEGIDLHVCVYRDYGESRSAGFELKDPHTNETICSMDVDVNRPLQPTKIYWIDDFRFRGITPAQMLADKICAVSTNKVFRRIKDVVDLYYLSGIIDLNSAEIMNLIINSGKSLENFDGFLHDAQSLKHAYQKYRFSGDVSKPEFEVIYCSVKSYIEDFLPKK